MSGELARCPDSDLGLSGGLDGGFRIRVAGGHCTLGLTLTRGGLGPGEAGLASARGLAICLGRACWAQVIGGSRRFLPKSWSGVIQWAVAASLVSGPSLVGGGFLDFDQ